MGLDRVKIETVDARIEQLTFNDYRSCWLVRDRKVALIETGYPSDNQMLIAGLAQLGLAPNDIDYLALTHIHLDHAGGAGHLARLNPKVTVCVHSKGARHLIDPGRLLMMAKKAHGKRYATMGEMLPVPESNLRVIDSGDHIDLGDTQLTVHYTPGHAKHHVVFYDPASASVFAGDVLGSKYKQRPNFILTPPDDYDKHLALKSIEMVQVLKPARINFAHCGTYQLSEQDSFFEDLKYAHDDWTQCIAEILNSNPESDFETLWTAFLDRRPDLAQYTDQHFSFRLSVQGIRTCLERSGRI